MAALSPALLAHALWSALAPVLARALRWARLLASFGGVPDEHGIDRPQGRDDAGVPGRWDDGRRFGACHRAQYRHAPPDDRARRLHRGPAGHGRRKEAL